MKLLSVVVVVALCGCWGALAVQVKAGNMSFPLDAVKELRNLMNLNEGVTDASIAAVCHNPLLPQVFVPACQCKKAEAIFSDLGKVFKYIDPCEICSYAACTGCVI
ncbi:guanylin-like [Betta splendens]|uniref:Guanylate cyclase activator 2B n=1 Tax=Betta splendens TaxID=158456 RepID=A0A6P7MHT6_BETSP|nr:guanylin-like [Betta splendens]